ncbi:MAG: NnrS family protein [bacterium]
MANQSPTASSVWQTEPFRIFFPLGVGIAWVGLSQWVFFPFGWPKAYACDLHGFIQMQAFTMAFAFGFLFTALPRRTQSAPPSRAELSATTALLVLVTLAGLFAQRVAMMLGYFALFALLTRFALMRLLGSAARRRPPAAFALVPIAALQGLIGPLLVIAGPRVNMLPWLYPLGRLFIEQGVFLCLIVGIGGLVLPLVGGWPPPADLGSSPRESRRALLFAAAGLVIVGSEIAEALGAFRAGPIVRGLVVALGLALGGGAWRAPKKSGLHRRLVWLAMWLTPLGVLLSGLLPGLRVASLHVLFIGGYSLMCLAVATHVSYAHLPGLESLMLTSHRAVKWMGGLVIVALLGRTAADVSHTYYQHLSSAAAAWIIGSAVWLGFLGPKLIRPPAAKG